MSNWLDVAPCGYLSFKDDGSIIYLNQTLSGWLGYSTAELLGTKVEHIFTVATRIFHNTHFFPLLKLHAKAEEIFLSLRAKNEDNIPVLASAERRVEDGMAINHCVFIAIFQRQKYEEEILAARREAEKALKENKYLEELRNSLEIHTLELEQQYQKQLVQHKNLTQFNKIVSHDLQEPIRKILLFSDILINDLGATLNEKNLTTISRIKDASTRLRGLTTGLQQYLTVDADQMDTDVDLNAVLETAKKRVIDGRHLQELDLVYKKMPVIRGYRAQLELLFYHLFDNAVQFADPIRSLRINITWVLSDENIYKMEKNKYLFVEHLRLTVSDNGIGFENEYKEYVTGLLNKLNPSTEGLGIGLSIITKVIDNHSGTLYIESKRNTGTSFSLLIPTKIHSRPDRTGSAS
ncbi:MAG TPA: ATP-binding protein [Chryseolinea sp.]|nr:ATP-binding protein [Chryseolinea sp.]